SIDAHERLHVGEHPREDHLGRSRRLFEDGCAGLLSCGMRLARAGGAGRGEEAAPGFAEREDDLIEELPLFSEHPFQVIAVDVMPLLLVPGKRKDLLGTEVEEILEGLPDASYALDQDPGRIRERV